MTGARVYQIWDQQTGALLADGLDGMAEARERLEEMLAMVRADSDSTDGMRLEWVIADSGGRIVAGHHGEPEPWPS